MNCLTLLPKNSPEPKFRVPRLNLDGITPDRLADLSLDELAQLEILADGRLERLTHWFEVRDGDRARLRLLGDCSNCERIGGQMRSGEILVEGSVGNFLAAAMRGGKISVTGDAGDYVCSSMSGGLVEVAGRVGDYAAAVEPYAKRGMRGGTLLVAAECGKWLGSRMRRGTVIVGGEVDLGCGSRMIAGTIVCRAPAKEPLGYAMARGSIMLLSPTCEQAQQGFVGFTKPQLCELSFLPMLVRHIASAAVGSLAVPSTRAIDNLTGPWLRCLGDRATGGQGEILMLRR